MFENLLRTDKSKTIVLFDFETFNLCLNFCHNLPWQAGILVVKGEEIIATHDILIKWKTHLRISPDAARITRYSQAKMDLYGIPPEDAFPVIKKRFEEADHIIMHNGYGFDIYLWREWCKLMGIDWKPAFNKLIDTNLLAKGVKLNVPYKPGECFKSYQYRMYHHIQKGLKTSLSTLGKEFNIAFDPEMLHDAIVDLRLNLDVWNILKWKVEI